MAGVPLTKNGDLSFGQLILETQFDRILYIEIENPEDMQDFGSITVRKLYFENKSTTTPNILKHFL